MQKIYEKLVEGILNISLKRPYIVLAIMLLTAIPAIISITHLQIDTNLLSLLPESNKSFVNTIKLSDKVGDRGHFIAFFESKNRDNLVKAAETASAEIAKIDEVENVQLHFPREFVKKFNFALIPNDYLSDIYEQALALEAEINPFVMDLGDEPEEEKEKTHGDVEDEQDLNVMLRQYLSLPEYYENEDGTIIGVMITTKDGITEIGKIRDLYDKISTICDNTGKKYSVWTGIGGNHRNKLNDLDVITKDLNVSGIISIIAILLLLFIGFRSLKPLLPVTLPLVIGLLWGFALVPILIGPLNLITSFLVLIMFGIGVDFSIHLVKRFLFEHRQLPLETALKKTYHATGLSVIVSGLTTAIAMSVLALSGFRGFSEFGIIACMSILFILSAMYLVLPSIIVIFDRIGLLNSKSKRQFSTPVFSSIPTIISGIVILALSIYAFFTITFDYNLSNINFDQSGEGDYVVVMKKHEEVFSLSMSPAALYLVGGINALDSFNLEVKAARDKESSMIGRIRSIRDFAPAPADAAERLELIRNIKEILSGKWTEQIEDKRIVNIIKQIEEWDTPDRCATIEEVPRVLKNSLVGIDTNTYLLTIYPKEERKDGKNAMLLTKNLYDIKNPSTVQGPIGETIIFAELLWLVTGKDRWIVLATLISVILIIYLNTRSLKTTAIILLPLITAFGTTLGIMSLLGIKISLFNVIIIPALIGMGVDGGVHYIRRWQENKKSVKVTQHELFEALSLATFTTMSGYSGMVFAHHSGINSIGIFACIGLIVLWFTTIHFLPGLLKLFQSKRNQP